MLLVEPVDKINYYLERDFGRKYDDRPEWRVVWSEDQYENRLIDVTDDGIQLINPEVRYIKKYQHITERFVLERLVPVVGETDLVTNLSYEPAWSFEDRFGNYLPPRYDACKFIIETILGQMDKANTHTQYKDDKASEEARQAMILDMEEKLFGNETPATDALAYGYGVAGFHQLQEKEKES